MTTIVATREEMASDSKVSVEHKGFSYPTIKIIRSEKGDAIIGAAGDGADCAKFLKWASSGFKGSEPKWSTDTTAGTEDSVVGLILRDSGIYLWTYGDGTDPEKIESDSWAIGSGGKPARVALLLGKSATEAVELAILVDDLYSGYPLQILKLKETGNGPSKD